MTHSLSRRAILAGGGAAALSIAAPRIALARRQQDIEIVDVLQAALALEQKTVITHDHMNNHQTLTDPEISICTKILDNHKRHTATLQEWLRRLGATPKPVSAPASVVNTRDKALKLSIELERALIDAYLTHASNLTGELLADAVTILIDETKHHTILSSWPNIRQA